MNELITHFNMIGFIVLLYVFAFYKTVFDLRWLTSIYNFSSSRGIFCAREMFPKLGIYREITRGLRAPNRQITACESKAEQNIPLQIGAFNYCSGRPVCCFFLIMSFNV